LESPPRRTIKEFWMIRGGDVQRRYVLNLPAGDLKAIVESRLRQLAARFEVPGRDGQDLGGH
jgi:hypothetical protein